MQSSLATNSTQRRSDEGIHELHFLKEYASEEDNERLCISITNSYWFIVHGFASFNTLLQETNTNFKILFIYANLLVFIFIDYLIFDSPFDNIYIIFITLLL